MILARDISKAIKFAAKAHHGQMRPDGSPYIVHPVEVMHILHFVGGITDRDILVSAVLHDTVEDCGVSKAQIKEEFGSEVRYIVGELTDDMSLPKEERKRLQIEHAPHMSDAAKQVKMADKISNCMGCVETDWTLEKKQGYVDHAELVVNAGLRGVNKALEDHFDMVVAKVRSQLS